jgi:hypothetical protein
MTMPWETWSTCIALRSEKQMFTHVWAWLLPLVSAAAVSGFVLATTPPGFLAVPQLVFASPRGPIADAIAYTLAAAASLGLTALLVMALICAAIERLLRARS